MHISILFIILTFTIIIGIIILSDSLTSAMIIVSLLANFLVISSHFGKISKNIIIKPARREFDDQPEAEHKFEPEPEEALRTIYGDKFDDWFAHKKGYTECYNAPYIDGIDSGIDTANALMASKRARDKRCLDGWASKNSDYYKFHFAGELDESEAKPWWGRTDY